MLELTITKLTPCLYERPRRTQRSPAAARNRRLLSAPLTQQWRQAPAVVREKRCQTNSLVLRSCSSCGTQAGSCGKPPSRPLAPVRSRHPTAVSCAILTAQQAVSVTAAPGPHSRVQPEWCRPAGTPLSRSPLCTPCSHPARPAISPYAGPSLTWGPSGLDG